MANSYLKLGIYLGLDIFEISIWFCVSSAKSFFSTLLERFLVSLGLNGFGTSSFEISAYFRNLAILFELVKIIRLQIY